ncbi:MAG: hypothetical protein ACRD45_21690, partial [Bryobacteraceae bacterium]
MDFVAMGAVRLTRGIHGQAPTVVATSPWILNRARGCGKSPHPWSECFGLNVASQRRLHCPVLQEAKRGAFRAVEYELCGILGDEVIRRRG